MRKYILFAGVAATILSLVVLLLLIPLTLVYPPLFCSPEDLGLCLEQVTRGIHQVSSAGFVIVLLAS
jgi:hypothetical protein